MCTRGFLARLDKGVRIMTNVLLALMTIDILIQVFFRYVLRDPLVWTEELARFLLAWLVFLGASSAVRSWDNLRVTYFIEKLPPKVFSVIETMTKLLSFGLLVYVFISAVRVIPNVGMREIAPALGIKMIIPELSLLVGLALMIIQLIGILISLIPKPRSGEEG
jgi:TRAP-type C4-dicarboxylate transport system permease small subunit